MKRCITLLLFGALACSAESGSHEEADLGFSQQPISTMSRDAIIARAKTGVGYSYWWAHGAWRLDGTQHGSCSGGCPSCSHSGSYGADCSGFVAKVWQVPNDIDVSTDAHPYSTYHFKNQSNQWSSISRADVQKGDAFVYNTNGAGHIFLFESGDPWGSVWAYECAGCATGCVHNIRTAYSNYSAIRRDAIGGPTLPSGGGVDGDVNGDGRSDLVSVNADGNAYVWPGGSDGKFDGNAVPSFDGTLNSANVDGEGHFIVAVNDVTGDGRSDLVSASSDGSAYVWPGMADGKFGTAVASFDGTLDSANADGAGHYIVGVNDVTGDGMADLVSVKEDGNAWVWPGTAGGVFGTAVPSFDGTLDNANLDGSGHFIVGVADVTGDGRSDLIGVNGDGNAWVWPGGADGKFGTGVPSFGGTLDTAHLDGTGHLIVGLSDVTGDGKADLVSVMGDGNAWVWPGAADGSFGSGVASFEGTLDTSNLDGTGHFIVGLADITGDGKSDLVSMNGDGSAYVWPGAADGSFGSAVGSFDGTMDAANLDGSGHYIVAPLGPEWETAPTSDSGGGTHGTGGGTGSPGQGGSGSGWSGSAGIDGNNGDPKKRASDDAGCACRSAGGSTETPWSLLLCAAFACFRRFRARSE